jgi:hypothetical protein
MQPAGRESGAGLHLSTHPPDKSRRRWEPVIIRFAESSKEFTGQGHGGGGGGRASFGATAKTRAGGIAHSERERERDS